MVASNLFLVFSGLLLIEYCTDNPQDIVVQSHTIYDIFLKNWAFPWNKPNSYWGFFMTKETLRGFFFFYLSSTSPGWWLNPTHLKKIRVSVNWDKATIFFFSGKHGNQTTNQICTDEFYFIYTYIIYMEIKPPTSNAYFPQASVDTSAAAHSERQSTACCCPMARTAKITRRNVMPSAKIRSRWWTSVFVFEAHSNWRNSNSSLMDFEAEICACGNLEIIHI